MDYDILFKTATVLIGALGSSKILYDLSIGRTGRLREEYRFAKEFLEEASSNEHLHPYLREKGYQAVAGDSSISADEIEYLLSLKGPERALKDYVLGRPYLEHLPDAGNLQIAFREKFKNSWSRRWRKALYIAAYFGSSFLAVAPLLLSNFLVKYPGQLLVAFSISAVVFGPYAVFSLKEGVRIRRAEKLVRNQSKHTQTVLLSRSNLIPKRPSIDR